MHPFRSDIQDSLCKRPIDDYNDVKELNLLTKSLVQGTINPTNLTKDSANATGIGGNMGLYKYGFNNCEKEANRTTNNDKYSPPKITVLPNVIVKYRSDNSDSQPTLPVPKNNIRKISKEIIRTSHQQNN